MGNKIVLLLTLHFVADFLLQSREMGKKKSSEPYWLALHLSIQFLVFSLVSWKFALANAAIHGVIDWNIWNVYKYTVKYRLLKKKREDVEYASPAEWDAAMAGTDDEYVAIAGRNWKYWEDHVFYSTIGFDQLLHGITIVLLAGWLL